MSNPSTLSRVRRLAIYRGVNTDSQKRSERNTRYNLLKNTTNQIRGLEFQAFHEGISLEINLPGGEPVTIEPLSATSVPRTNVFSTVPTTSRPL